MRWHSESDSERSGLFCLFEVKHSVLSGTPAVEGRETFGPFKCRINVLRLTRRCTSHNTVVAPWETLLNKSYAPPRSTQRWVAPADRRLFRSVQNSYEPFFWAYSEFETSVSSENMSSVVEIWVRCKISLYCGSDLIENTWRKHFCRVRARIIRTNGGQTYRSAYFKAQIKKKTVKKHNFFTQQQHNVKYNNNHPNMSAADVSSTSKLH